MEKLYNEVIIDQLAEMEYVIRDGLVLSEKQKKEIGVICNQIMSLINEQAIKPERVEKMKYKTTAKDIKEGYYCIIRAGYCSLCNLLKSENPVAYSKGVYGWNFDVYDIDGVAIATGYRGMPKKNSKEDYSLIREYELKASEIEGWDDTAKANRKALLKEFIEKVRV